MGSIAITLVVCKAPNDCELIITNAIISTKMMLTNISFVKCQFISDDNRIILAENRDPILSNLKANILFESVLISHNHISTAISIYASIIISIISITTMNVHINGTFTVTNNHNVSKP